MFVPRLLTVSLVVLVSATPSSPSYAAGDPPTCQGKTATIVGVQGTEGDDVMVAPITSETVVDALGGNDTICLVDGPSKPSRYSAMSVKAGSGDDAVYNETSLAYHPDVELGAGADYFRGHAFAEYVSGSSHEDSDTEVDVIETGGGWDEIYSGSTVPGVENHDLVSTGAGQDHVYYLNAAGETIDNGQDADSLYLTSVWPGGLSIDNTARTATVAGVTALIWTAVEFFTWDAPAKGGSFSFIGSAADENVQVYGDYPLVDATATIATRGGNDQVVLVRYFPGRVATGRGHDGLTWIADCQQAAIKLDARAQCVTRNQEVGTSLAGIESLLAEAGELEVRGTARGESISAYAWNLTLNSFGGDDWVTAQAEGTMKVLGGRGDDHLTALNPSVSDEEHPGMARGAWIYGGRGNDVLNGHRGPDHLYGGRGYDLADGLGGTDTCRAETTWHCEA